MVIQPVCKNAEMHMPTATEGCIPQHHIINVLYEYYLENNQCHTEIKKCMYWQQQEVHEGSWTPQHITLVNKM